MQVHQQNLKLDIYFFVNTVAFSMQLCYTIYTDISMKKRVRDAELF